MLRLLLTAACAIPLCCVPLASAAGDDPPLRLVLRVDGADHEVTDGQEIVVTVAGKEVRAKATVRPTRRFEAEGIRFDFPRDMWFERDTDAARWKIEGDDCEVVIHRFRSGDPATLARDLLSGMLTHLDKDAASPQSCEVQLGALACSGLRGRAQSGATTFESTAVGLSVGGKPYVLLLHDTLGEDGKLTAESSQMRELLKTTFAFAK